MTLGQLLTEKDRAAIQPLFSFGIDSIECWIMPKDGAGGTLGSYSAKKGRISLDEADTPLLPDGRINTQNPRVLETVIHELFHVAQNRRGFLYRLKMWFWRTFFAYAKRPHELEAREFAQKAVKEIRG